MEKEHFEIYNMQYKYFFFHSEKTINDLKENYLRLLLAITIFLKIGIFASQIISNRAR